MEISNLVTSRIKLLDAELASQIAAGEVIERPASVLKELLENSIDSDATQIDVKIQRGGVQLIEVRDNGSGIVKEDLQLALKQHATSKIHTSDDLAAISSLGFRGEALASIDSVTHLSITSRTAGQPNAWCIAKSEISPAAHPVGTTVTMRDLFYNVPARRKFLRSERTEYQHLEEVFRRIALSNFTVGFSLTHQDKLIKSLAVCTDAAARTRRVINLCGQQVMAHALNIDAEQNGLYLWGWLGSPQHARSQETHQYFFINGRVIRDRLINHAIRQVFQPLCGEGKMPFYCLYLELDPVALDVNVHPTKHEVRFRDVRIIHAFLTQTLADVLVVAGVDSKPQIKQLDYAPSKLNTSYQSVTNYIEDSQPSPKSEFKLLAVLDHKLIVAQRADKLILIDAVSLQKNILLQDIQQDLIAQNLLLPLPVRLPQEFVITNEFVDWCAKRSVKAEQIGENSMLVRALPKALHNNKVDVEQIILQLCKAYKDSIDDLQQIAQGLVSTVNFDSGLTEYKAQELLRTITLIKYKNIWRELSIEECLNVVNLI